MGDGTRRYRLRARSGALPILALALGSAVMLTACGRAAPKSATSGARYGPKNSPASLSRCMRANGVSGFPDPEAGPGGAVGLPLIVSSNGSLTAEGKSFSGPALRHAERVCKTYLPPAGGPPPQLVAAQRRRELAFAQCMRKHGVPSYPDPSLSGGGQAPPAGVDPQSPAFKTAARACGGGGNRSIG
ncbi:MAG: hypothetical protein ACRDKL_08595 [Solirubrobacteraceae bacterium]